MSFDGGADESEPLSHESARELIARIRKHSSGSTRGAVFYRNDDHEVIYLRDDIEAAYSRSEVEDVMEDIILETFGDTTRLTELLNMGELRSTIRWFEEGVLLNLPYDSRSGIAITFDHAISGNLSTIVATGTNYLDQA